MQYVIYTRAQLKDYFINIYAGASRPEKSVERPPVDIRSESPLVEQLHITSTLLICITGKLIPLRRYNNGQARNSKGRSNTTTERYMVHNLRWEVLYVYGIVVLPEKGNINFHRVWQGPYIVS